MKSHPRDLNCGAHCKKPIVADRRDEEQARLHIPASAANGGHGAGFVSTENYETAGEMATKGLR